MRFIRRALGPAALASLALGVSACGSSSTFVPDNKEVADAQAASSRPAAIPPGTLLRLEFDVTGEPSNPKVLGTTNLPDGTDIGVSFDKVGVDYSTGGQGKVLSGHFMIGPVDSFGKTLPPGKYKVEITTPLADVQPDDVRSAVGPDYENFTGPLLKEKQFGRGVSVTKNYIVPGIDDSRSRGALRQARQNAGDDYARQNCVTARKERGQATLTPKAQAEIARCVHKYAPVVGQ